MFSNERIDPMSLLSVLNYLRNARVEQRGDNTLTVFVDRGGLVKISFFGDLQMAHVKDPDAASSNGLHVASLLDLTATKLKTIQQRAEAKDFVDIAVALRFPKRFLAYVMTYGTLEDVLVVKRHFSAEEFLSALSDPPGIFDPASWTYWNLTFHREPVPPLPKRSIPG